MKISTKGQYGLQALVHMVVYCENGYAPLSAIAEREDISIKYLEQVFSLLKKAGIVKSIKGASGGYVLSDKPSNIMVSEVLKVLEGDYNVTNETKDFLVNSIQYSIKATLYDRLNDSINAIVRSISLEDIAKDYLDRKNSGASFFYI